MRNQNIKYVLFVSTFLIPSLAFAALGGVIGLLRGFLQVLSVSVPVVFGICLIYFFWGLGQFILNDAGNDKTRQEGKQKIIWGIIALFVFVSIYGILSFIGGALGIAQGGDFSGIFGP